jgi:hypothetical protein
MSAQKPVALTKSYCLPVLSVILAIKQIDVTPHSSEVPACMLAIAILVLHAIRTNSQSTVQAMQPCRGLGRSASQVAVQESRQQATHFIRWQISRQAAQVACCRPRAAGKHGRGCLHICASNGAPPQVPAGSTVSENALQATHSKAAPAPDALRRRWGWLCLLLLAMLSLRFIEQAKEKLAMLKEMQKRTNDALQSSMTASPRLIDFRVRDASSEQQIAISKLEAAMWDKNPLRESNSTCDRLIVQEP